MNTVLVDEELLYVFTVCITAMETPDQQRGLMNIVLVGGGGEEDGVQWNHHGLAHLNACISAFIHFIYLHCKNAPTAMGELLCTNKVVPQQTIYLQLLY